MNAERFNTIVELWKARIDQSLSRKAVEYANDSDRLHNFHSAAKFQEIHPVQVCWNFMIKHLTSINDMVNDYEREDAATMSLDTWDEKIGDSINYLILLSALLREDY